MTGLPQVYKQKQQKYDKLKTNVSADQGKLTKVSIALANSCLSASRPSKNFTWRKKIGMMLMRPYLM